MKIGDFNFKNNTRTFIVAELSANHNKDINVMIESIKAGELEQMVKIQTYTPDTMTIESNKSDFVVKGTME